MKTFIVSSLAALAPIAAFAAPANTSVTVSYDTKYDNAGLDLDTTSCSDGQYGLVTKGYKTAGALPSFPNIGGAFTVPGWNSPNCGKCYQLSWEGKSIYVTAVDHTAEGFNIGQKALDTLTGGLAVQVGRVTATYSEADPSSCGL
ncbi:hypothetical protein DTO027B5_4544 [Paecilomyces variotii]|nr:hypothetical protein DTO027B3_5475 [Paecilomyces variotii]KAJ9333764.1 hypothetical protein DTO027B5_4544 [Paecilomyces variotii]